MNEADLQAIFGLLDTFWWLGVWFGVLVGITAWSFFGEYVGRSFEWLMDRVVPQRWIIALAKKCRKEARP